MRRRRKNRETVPDHGGLCSAGDTWPCQRPFWLSQLGVGLLAPRRWGPGCCSAPYSVQESPTTMNPPTGVELRNPTLGWGGGLWGEGRDGKLRPEQGRMSQSWGLARASPEVKPSGCLWVQKAGQQMHEEDLGWRHNSSMSFHVNVPLATRSHLQPQGAVPLC